PRSLAWHRTWRPGRRWRFRQSGGPLRPAPMASASPASQPQLARVDRAARIRRGPEPRNAQRTPACGGWDSIGVDEGPIWGGVGEVLDAVVAHAPGEVEGHLLLLGTPLVAREPRWLEVLTCAVGLLERRAARVHRRSVRYPIDGQRARRVGVRERADPVGAHALGELHRLLVRGGGAVARAGRSVPTARDDHGEHGKSGQGPECPTHGFSLGSAYRGGQRGSMAWGAPVGVPGVVGVDPCELE